MKISLFLTVFLISSTVVYSQDPPTPPFNRGVNLTGWFQANSAGEINFRRYTKADFQNIKSLGCDVIRLPINMKGMTSGAPEYNFDPLFFTLLDSAVAWANETDLHLILDNHTFNVSENTLTSDIDYLLKIWNQLAKHYKSAPEKLYYEILNEPHGIADSDWNSMQKKVIDEIRSIDQVHTIIVGPAGWNSYNNLDEMPVYDDPNLIYTFHFYDPFLFTHQGASWVTPTLVPLANMPFPYLQKEMPALDASFNGTWIESAYNNYHNEGTAAHVKNLIDIAVKFRNERNVPLYCGEFGVYQKNSDETDRIGWYKLVREYLEENNIAWTLWDYHHGFGIFEEGTVGRFEHDLNVPLLEALNLNVPEQTPYEKQPESTGFMIYDDFLGPDLQNSGYTAGTIDFFSNTQPNNGYYIIQWTGAVQYNSLGFDFISEKDLSYLAEENYALDLFIRGIDLPEDFSFDIRFIDTKKSPEDRPWRNRYTVTTNELQFDGFWHHLHIPLAAFTEHGAWDNGWYNPVGDFNWSEMDILEISTESGPMGEGKLWIDNIIITDQDTAKVLNQHPYDHRVTGFNFPESYIKIYPNPATAFLTVSSKNNLLKEELLNIFDLKGKNIISIPPSSANEYKVDCSALEPGLYLLRSASISGRFIKVRQ